MRKDLHSLLVFQLYSDVKIQSSCTKHAKVSNLSTVCLTIVHTHLWCLCKTILQIFRVIYYYKEHQLPVLKYMQRHEFMDARNRRAHTQTPEDRSWVHCHALFVWAVGWDRWTRTRTAGTLRLGPATVRMKLRSARADHTTSLLLHLTHCMLYEEWITRINE